MVQAISHLPRHSAIPLVVQPCTNLDPVKRSGAIESVNRTIAIALLSLMGQKAA